jgi:NAD(P)H dehydrogenase (quinone)
MILVTGASGYVGSRAVRRLAERGAEVTAMGRDEARLRKVIPEGIPLVIADYDDRESLDRAVAQARKLIFVASDGFAEDLIRQHAQVIDAVNRSPIAETVFTSIVDVEDGSPFYFAPVYRDAERRLKLARFSSVILRCGLYSDFILQHWLHETAISLPLADARITPVSRDDVAAAAVHAVLGPAVGTAQLTGAVSYSMAEIAAVATRAFGKRYSYQPCAPEAYFERLTAGVDDPWPEAFSTLCASIREGRYAATSPHFPQEDFESFLRRSAQGQSLSRV